MTEQFNENLIRFRKQSKLTQVQLAKMINVTPQAISKWERGSLPDSELLPTIAKALGVSIDALFGLSDEKEEPNLEQLVNNQLHRMPENERADAAMKLFYSIIGAYEYKLSKVRFPERLECETYAEIRSDYEMALERLNEDLKYCAFIKIPEDGLYHYFSETDRMVQLFETLADEDALRLVCYLGSGRRNRMQSLEFMARNTGIPLEKVGSVIERLDHLGIVWRVAIDDEYTENGRSSIVYGYTNSTPLTMILVLASSLTRYIRYHSCYVDVWKRGPFRMTDICTEQAVSHDELPQENERD